MATDHNPRTRHSTLRGTRARLGVEALERRELRAVYSFYGGGLLTVSTDAGDPIAISCEPIVFGPARKVLVNGSHVNDALCKDVTDITVSGTAGLPNSIDLHLVGPGDYTSLARVDAGGGNADDSIYGSQFADTLSGFGGFDALTGADGDDRIYGGHGDDQLLGLDGKDTIYGGLGDDQIDGGDKNDELYGDEDDDFVQGDGGDDTVSGGIGDDTLYGDDLSGFFPPGNDLVLGGDGWDELYGGPGNDFLYGGGDNDVISGDGGNDNLDGEEGDDSLMGGADHDTILGGTGVDTLSGDQGDDSLSGGTGPDYIYGGTGRDTAFGVEFWDYIDADVEVLA